MTHVEFQRLNYITRVTIPRTMLPENNVAMILAILGSLTYGNGPVVNTEDIVVFNYSQINNDILCLFLQRWGVNLENSTWS